MGAIGAGVGAGVGQLAQSTWLADASQTWGGFGATMVRGAIGSAATQGLSMAAGLQQKFSWSQVAASAVGTAAGNAVGNAIGTGDFAQNFMRGFGGSMVSGGVQALISGEKPNWGLIAANSFGQASGDALSRKIVES